MELLPSDFIFNQPKLGGKQIIELYDDCRSYLFLPHFDLIYSHVKARREEKELHNIFPFKISLLTKTIHLLISTKKQA